MATEEPTTAREKSGVNDTADVVVQITGDDYDRRSSSSVGMSVQYFAIQVSTQ